MLLRPLEYVDDYPRPKSARNDYPRPLVSVEDYPRPKSKCDCYPSPLESVHYYPRPKIWTDYKPLNQFPRPRYLPIDRSRCSSPIGRERYRKRRTTSV